MCSGAQAVTLGARTDAFSRVRARACGCADSEEDEEERRDRRGRMRFEKALGVFGKMLGAEREERDRKKRELKRLKQVEGRVCEPRPRRDSI